MRRRLAAAVLAATLTSAAALPARAAAPRAESLDFPRIASLVLGWLWGSGVEGTGTPESVVLAAGSCGDPSGLTAPPPGPSCPIPSPSVGMTAGMGLDPSGGVAPAPPPPGAQVLRGAEIDPDR